MRQSPQPAPRASFSWCSPSGSRQQSQIYEREQTGEHKSDDRDSGSVADHAFGKRLLIPVKLKNIGGIGRSALGHDEDEIEHAQGIDGAKQECQYESGFDQRQRNVAEYLP